jgi:hypothetical protein
MAMTKHLRAATLLPLLGLGLLGAQACSEEDDGGGTGGSQTTVTPSGGSTASGGSGTTSSGGSGTTSSGGSGTTSSGGSGTTSSGGSGAGASGGAGGAPSGDCPLTGTWEITGVACSFYDVTEDYFAVMTSGTMTVTDLPVTGCAWTIVNVSPACTTSESYETTDPIPGTVMVTSHGIQSCDPPGCSFTEDGEACALGAHAGDAETEIELDGDTLTTTGPQGPCAAYFFDTTVTWVRVD